MTVEMFQAFAGLYAVVVLFSLLMERQTLDQGGEQ